MFSHMDIDKILKNDRLVRVLLGVTKEEFLSLLKRRNDTCARMW
ncbi:MAG: hypothetical protein UY07_C0030G0007 [Parcubacteria group bacterium GW2011_GWA1_47_8]|nr:MAG: hypothetical protein UY07_C0030G0007 [Parcubacteria group bacterium GW2011_GWA1_47_8]